MIWTFPELWCGIFQFMAARPLGSSWLPSLKRWSRRHGIGRCKELYPCHEILWKVRGIALVVGRKFDHFFSMNRMSLRDIPPIFPEGLSLETKVWAMARDIVLVQFYGSTCGHAGFDQLQCCDQFLRKRPAVAMGIAIVPRDADPTCFARRYPLQCRHQLL